MSILTSAFVALCTTAGIGAVLFLSYTFRMRVRYPLVWVVTHIATAASTLVLFTIFLIHRSILPEPMDGKFLFACISYFVLLATFVTGLVFFVRYDFQKRSMGMKRLSLHIVMAGCTLFALSGTTAVYASYKQHSGYHVGGSSWYNIHKHASLHQK